jgi:PAS domain S-box-containing protein
MNTGIPSTISLDLLETLFDQHPDNPFFMKDAELRYIAVNDAMVHFCGARSKKDLIGKRASDFFTKSLYERYERLDRQILATGRPLTYKMDQSVAPGRPLVWLLFHRFPVKDKSGNISGIVATARQLLHPGQNHPKYSRLHQVIEYINDNCEASLDLKALAGIARVSVSQLDRDFQNIVGLSPRQFQLQARFNKALEMMETEPSIAAVAYACGYADQSAFTRRFKKIVGCTPREYRARLRPFR